MKYLALLLFSVAAMGSSKATRPFTMAIVDTSSTNITTGYDGANAEVLSGLASPENLLVWNETGLNIGVSVPTGSSCLVSSPDHFVAPGVAASAAGVAVDDVAVNKVVCLRSLSGGTISTGTVYVSVW
jgi:hypothetical protein